MRRLKTPRLKKADIWTALAVLGLMALSVPSLKDDTASGKGDKVIAQVKAQSSHALAKAVAFVERQN